MMGDALEGCKKCLHYIDDVLIWGSTKEEHDRNLETVIAALEKAGFAINREKSEFCRPEVTYLGNLINGSEVRPNPEKVKVLLECPAPNNADEVR